MFTCWVWIWLSVVTRCVFRKYRQFFTDSPRSLWSHSHSPNRVGIHWILPSLKVYYPPFVPIASSAMLPNFFTFLPYLWTILTREHIHLTPARASLSSLVHEGILRSHLLGIRTVFTDHSLFGFTDAVSILINKLLAGTLRNVDAVICVSHTGWGYLYFISLLYWLSVGGRAPSFEEGSLTNQAESGIRYMLFRMHWYQSIFSLERWRLVVLVRHGYQWPLTR